MSTLKEEQIAIRVGDSVGSVAGLLLRPVDAFALYVFAHGAGADMNHHFMHDAAHRLAARGVASLRYQFPYTHARKKRPDPPGILEATVAAALAAGGEPGVPLFAGGKSMGGRMTSQLMSKRPDAHVRGLVFYGFPLHAAGAVSDLRAEHLSRVPVPMLFLQGTRDALADMNLMKGVCDRLGESSTLHVVEGADHGFHVLKRSGRTEEQVLDELADTASRWIRARCS